MCLKSLLRLVWIIMVYYFSATGLGFDTMFKMTGVKLQTISDIKVHLFIENGMKGGISNICKRYPLANNKYLKNYDSNKENTFIVYWDANNLYGWGMNQPLPYSDFNFLTKKEINEFCLDCISENSPVGYILEVGLEYCKELHDSHNDYPLTPEKLDISSNMLSKYCSDIANKYGIKVGGVNKLVANLRDKVKYIAHYRNLQLHLELGMKFIKFHRILKFKQPNWLKEYMNLILIKEQKQRINSVKISLNY